MQKIQKIAFTATVIAAMTSAPAIQAASTSQTGDWQVLAHKGGGGGHHGGEHHHEHEHDHEHHDHHHHDYHHHHDHGYWNDNGAVNGPEYVEPAPVEVPVNNGETIVNQPVPTTPTTVQVNVPSSGSSN